MKIYHRPTGFVFGAAARALVKEGEALHLAGMPHIAFTQVEVCTRQAGGIAREMQRLSGVDDSAALERLSARRADFAGLAMTATRLMGIVNVTPDSFSDGGRLNDAEAAIAHGELLASEGADLLDVGGESTRPGSDTVDDAEELRRVLPVVQGLAARHCVSIDTRKAAVMRAALAAGAQVVNDVSALRFEKASAEVVAQAGAPVVLMHAQGEPKTMQLAPKYDDVLLDVYDGLEERVNEALAAGIPRDRICVDPGIGFGKSFRQNLDLMAGLTLFHGLGLPLLVGLSRKGFVGALTDEKVAANRAHGSAGGALQAALMGAHILRVHDVKATRQALSVFEAGLDPDLAEI
ncbi:MAG: dihydropteroate synthase [Proteobacteria bacterium]|nr:dihydropteroate synthase [Pseudomonadota bacterium]